MSPPTGQQLRFIGALERLVETDNRAALAALRRGLGKRPGEVADPAPYVAPWAPEQPWREAAFYLIGALFALHQMSWHRDADRRGPTNLGASLARLRAETGSDSVERRFIALLNAHPQDLPEHLRHVVALLKSKEVPIDWGQLLADVEVWGLESRPAQREWARAFWSVESGGATIEESPGEADRNGADEDQDGDDAT